MAVFQPDDLLVRAPDVRLDFDAANAVRVHSGGKRRLLCGPAAVQLLLRLHAPMRAADVLAALPGEGAQAWMDRSTSLVALCAAGVVTVVDREASVAERSTSARQGFDSQQQHVLMLEDEQRTTAFLRAIASVVRPGDVVADIGTGTGVLAVAAARAGAGHVYAVEAGGIGDLAATVIAGSGWSDRITLVRGWSTEVVLPERVDVVVSETIGSDPFCERVLEVMRDARERHAAPGARFVPDRLQLFATGFASSRSCTATFSPPLVDRWSQLYEADFSSLLQWEGRVPMLWTPRAEVARWHSLTGATVLADVLLDGSAPPTVDVGGALEVTEPGRLAGAYVHFDARLSEHVTLSTAVGTAPSSSWLHPTALLPPREVQPGDAVHARYRYRARTEDGLSLSWAGPGGHPDA